MINKVILVGNVGSDPSYRVMDGGVKSCSFRVATTERFKKEDGTYNEQTEWHNVMCWSALADIADKHIHKGDRLYVEGSLHYRTFTDKDNIERKVTSITAKEIKMLSPKKDAPSQSVVKENLTTQPQASAIPPIPTAHPDDLPWL